MHERQTGITVRDFKTRLQRQKPRYQWEENAKIYLTESVEIFDELFWLRTGPVSE